MIFGRPVQFEEAIRANEIKELLPTTLSSRELAMLNADLKRRARFSATVADIGFLDRLDKLVTKIAGGPGDEDFAARLRGERPLMISIPEAKAQLLEYLRATGYQPAEGEAGTIKDLTTDRRLQLIVETNVLDTQGFGRWKSSQNPQTLDAFPAWQLVRMKFSDVPRDWPARWNEARYETGEPEGATDSVTGRMVALKNHPIWEALGDPTLFDDGLGNPWPPFAFNSGMNVIDVRRRDAVALGLLRETTRIPVEKDDRGLNDDTQASVRHFNEALQAALEEDELLDVVDGVLQLRDRTENSKHEIRNSNALVRNRLAGVLQALTPSTLDPRPSTLS